jgi:ribosomal protein S1
LTTDEPPLITPEERALIGTLVTGTVEAVFRWGVIVNLGLTHPGYIDPLYIEDTDRYVVGQVVEAYLSSFNASQRKFWLRPPGQIPVAERLP